MTMRLMTTVVLAALLLAGVGVAHRANAGDEPSAPQSREDGLAAALYAYHRGDYQRAGELLRPMAEAGSAEPTQHAQ